MQNRVFRSLLAHNIGTIVIFSVFFSFIAYRAYYVAFVSVAAGDYSFGELMLKTVVNDVFVVGFILLLELLSGTLKSKRLAALPKIMIVLIVLAYAIDVLIFKYLANRINVDDILQYGGELSVIGEIIAAVSSTKFGLASLFLMVAFFAAVPKYILTVTPLSGLLDLRGSDALRRTVMPVSVGLMIIIYSNQSAPDNDININQVRMGNLFFVSSMYSYKRDYSDSFVESYRDILEDITDSKLCGQGKGENRNVILVIVESLSSYHSDYISGIEDYMPNLDYIAAENIAFTGFHANGFTTVGGYMAILNGLIPVPKTTNEYTNDRGGWISLAGFEKNPFSSSLPEVYKQNGYKTVFLSNGDLEFGGSYDWLEAIGFEEIEDARAPEYEGYDRYLFNAPPDSVLFERAKKKVSEITGKYIMVLSTISTHRPYIDFETGKPTNEEGSFRQLDAALGTFYEFLKKSGYFEDGILLITGDHRARTPPLKAEMNRYGKQADDRIPLVIVDTEFGEGVVITDDYQHVDLFSSLKAFASKDTCRDGLYGNFYDEPLSPPKCVFFARGDSRSIVRVSCGQQSADVLLEGDNTRVLRGKIDYEDDAVKLINSLRLF